MPHQNNFNEQSLIYRQKAKSIWKIWLNYFLRGLLVVLPVALTVGIVYWAINFLTKLFHLTDDKGNLHFIYILLGILIITGIGYFVKGFVAGQILDFLEGIVEKAPGLKFIFGTTRDMTEAFVGDKKKFTQPVVVEIGHNIYKIGFVTRTNMESLGLPGFSSVYFPYSYGLNGEMLIVKNEQIKPVDKESSQVTKFIISGGIAEFD